MPDVVNFASNVYIYDRGQSVFPASRTKSFPAQADPNQNRLDLQLHSLKSTAKARVQPVRNLLVAGRGGRTSFRICVIIT